jgi:hypothetical protein
VEYQVEVGELVVLSAYGKKISVNYRVDESVGLILEVQTGNDEKSSFDVYKVLWSGGGGTMWHIRRDLKKAKKTS